MLHDQTKGLQNVITASPKSGKTNGISCFLINGWLSLAETLHGSLVEPWCSKFLKSVAEAGHGDLFAIYVDPNKINGANEIRRYLNGLQ